MRTRCNYDLDYLPQRSKIDAASGKENNDGMGNDKEEEISSIRKRRWLDQAPTTRIGSLRNRKEASEGKVELK